MKIKKISDIAEPLRPREKLEEQGPLALSDIELVALILGSGGSKGGHVMDLADKVVKLLDNGSVPPSKEELKRIKGVGAAKTAQMIAVFELARRRLIKKDVGRITKVDDVIPLLEDIRNRKQEHFVCISLNGANEVIERRVVTVGILNKCQIHPREVFADVITDRAASVILAHNHPSGDLTPSKEDISVQRQLTEAGSILGIRILDHIIVSSKGHVSFQEKGLID